MRITVRSLKYKMSQCGISVRSRYSLISIEDLESIVRQICTENEQLGEVSVKSRLVYYGLKVQRSRVRAAIAATIGQIIQPRRIRRRVYYVRAPLPVIHLDGNHKLVRYEISIAYLKNLSDFNHVC
jgi:hypothetical protein